MKTKYSKFLIISTFLILVGGVYLYVSRDLNSQDNIIPVAFGSDLASSTGSDLSPTGSSLSSDIASDISFLSTLVSLKSIKIDVTLFSNKSFSILKNNSVKIDPVIPGRQNPFAPIGSNNNVVSAPNIVTEQPTQITDKTATLNGTVNITTGVTETYFKYGITENPNTIVKVEQSLVGTFIKNVLGLTPKTNYFFKACAKVNNIELCGEVVPFTTN